MSERAERSPRAEGKEKKEKKKKKGKRKETKRVAPSCCLARGRDEKGRGRKDGRCSQLETNLYRILLDLLGNDRDQQRETRVSR